ncbi:hypothetical protein [Streptomyces sp. NPDC048242]|uniref:hypothetical protein n=1 Tax=Streptomyces sp. NPDC048242 TaxID=3155026 RepID=UPI00341BB343
MQVAGVDIGATDWVPLSLALGDAPVASCDTHVAVRVRPQTGLVKVRLFGQRQAGDLEGADPAFVTVFDGPLLLSDGRLAVGDVEQVTRFVHRLGYRGEYGVRVAVDSPGADARAIDVTCHRSG